MHGQGTLSFALELKVGEEKGESWEALTPFLNVFLIFLALIHKVSSPYTWVLLQHFHT